MRAAQPTEIAKKEANVRSRVVVVKAAPNPDREGSKAIIDPWDDISAYDNGYGIIEPPYDPVGLLFLHEESGELGPAVEAYETNIVGFGWRLQPIKHVRARTEDDIQDSFDAAVRNEYERITNFLDYADYDDESYTEFKKRVIRDQEITGNGYYEVIRDLNGQVQMFKHLPSYTMRLTRQDPEEQIITQKQQILRGKRSKIRYRTRLRRFRKFIQSSRTRSYRSESTNVEAEDPSLMWFKEYGDPRTMDCRTGQYVEPGTIEPRYEAHEVIHMPLNKDRGPYGAPRWLGALLAVLGVRSSEEINLCTFKNNNIPSMALMVSGGFVSEASINRLQEYVQSAIQGDDNYSKFIILEAEGFDDDMGTGTQNVKLDLKPLTQEQHTDAMFQAYDSKSREKIRQTFRLAPIYVGRAEDYTRATADTARKLTDEQVFGPRREAFDHHENRFLVQEFDMVFHQYKTNTPNVTNDQDLVRVASGAEKTGGMTPRIAHAILEDIMGRELPKPSGIDLDIPFSLQMAEAVKNKAQANEPGQQVTALKSTLLRSLEDVMKSATSMDEVVDWLQDLALESGWTIDELAQLMLET